MLDLFSSLHLPDLGALVARGIPGIFFGISGFHKLFVPSRHQSLKNNLTRNGIPWIPFNEWFVPAVEFLAGVTLTLGLFTAFSAALLGAICLVASCCEGSEKVAKWHCINKFDRLDTWLYLPEIVYGFLLLVVILQGPGNWSLDFFLF